jgi:hypothetical protein
MEKSGASQQYLVTASGEGFHAVFSQGGEAEGK